MIFGNSVALAGMLLSTPTTIRLHDTAGKPKYRGHWRMLIRYSHRIALEDRQINQSSTDRERRNEPFGDVTSAGHTADVPVHFSSTSHF